MKILYRYFAIFFPSLLTLISCGRNNSTDEVNNNDGDNPQTETCKANPFTDIDVYSLIENTGCNEVLENSGVWKNFNFQTVKKSQNVEVFQSFFVSDSKDIYTISRLNGDDKKIIKKNGEIIYSFTKADVNGSDDFMYAPAHLFVDGTDVYYGNSNSISGGNNWHYYLFKNGTKIGTTSIPITEYSHDIYGIGKINGKVVAYGTYQKNSYDNYQKMCYWENGKDLKLYPNPVNLYRGTYGGDMFISNNSLYLVRNWGTTVNNTNGYCYKDGVEIYKSTDNKTRYNYLNVNNGNVYISGSTEVEGKEYPAYWKNGVMTVYKNFNYESLPPYFNQMDVENNKVVIGTIYNDQPFVYIDGTLYPLCIKNNSCKYFSYGLQVIAK